MARSIRDDMKRKTAQAVNHIVTAIVQINEVYEKFDEAKKPEAVILGDAIQTLATQQETLLQFAKKAWDLDPEGLQGFM